MKRTIIILFIAFFLITYGIVEIVLINHVVDTLNNQVNQVIDKYPKTESSITHLTPDIEKIKSDWDSHEFVLNLIINHKNLDQISESLNRLIKLTKLNEYNEAEIELFILQNNSSKVINDIGFNLSNIL